MWHDSETEVIPFNTLVWVLLDNNVIRLVRHSNFGLLNLDNAVEEIPKIDESCVLAWCVAERPKPPTKKIKWE